MSNKTYRLFAEKLGGRTSSQFIGNEGEIFYDPTTNSLRISDGSTMGGQSILSGGSEVSGCFHKTAEVTAAASDTVYAFDWYTDTTAHITDGVTVTSAHPTRVVLSSAGDYEAFVEMQVRSTGNAERDVFLWLAKKPSAG